jgi:hypothetical protein
VLHTRSSKTPRPRPLSLVTVVVLASSLVVGSVVSASARVNVPRRGTWFGAYIQASGGRDQFESVRAFERMVGRHVRVVNKYHPFTDHNFDFEAKLIRNGRIPMVSWRATNDSPDGNRAAEIARGDWDGTIRTVARALGRLNGRVLVRFNWEMDQPPGSRQYIGPPSDFIRAWRHVDALFRQERAGNAQLVWAPRAGSFKQGAGQRYFPGASYVDWIGASAVPIDSYNSFGDLYGTFYRWAIKRHRPVMIWSGVRENPSVAGWKADWFRRAGSKIRRDMPKVKAWVYYHALSPLGYRFQVDTTGSALNAYRRVGAMDWFHPARLRRAA